MGDDPEPVPPVLTPDSLATLLGGPPPRIPHGYVAFKGYLSAASSDIHRLYTDDTFWSWLEVHKDQIADRKDIESNERDSRSVFWVKRDAKVTKCQVGYAYDLEDEVWGIDPGGGPNAGKRPPY